MAAGCARERLERLRAACAAEHLDAFFVRDLSSIRWLTAFDDVFDDEDAHALLVDSRDVVLHTDSRYTEAARQAAEGTSIAVDDKRQTHSAFAIRFLAEGRTVALGIEDTLMLGEYRALEAARAQAASSLQVRETSGFVRSLRAVKDPTEVARLKAAQAITDAAFAHLVGFMRAGMTERAVQIELEDFMRRHGADGLAFPSIVATGANGASPHAIPGDTPLEAGQCVVLDFGARAQGYCSDMTRTVFLGAPDARMRAAYEAIRCANERVQAALKPGVTGAAMHALAEQVLAEAGFGGKMGHSLGHGVGIDIHEEPNLSPRNSDELVEGNVVTIEPGVYLPGEFGMRLEDFGVLTHEGFAVFTESGHDMMVI
ncbi:M24 family metallopeptidase [Gordonibacter sp.]|uniref:M24 family metallopeptidase n=1 Tax=Gordonibacter sp. TaxID=1968902 RepID=UPI002FCAF807